MSELWTEVKGLQFGWLSCLEADEKVNATCMTSGPVVIGYCSGSSRWKEAGADVKHTIKPRTPGVCVLCETKCQITIIFLGNKRQPITSIVLPSNHSTVGRDQDEQSWRKHASLELQRCRLLPPRTHIVTFEAEMLLALFMSLLYQLPKVKIWLFSCLMLPYYHQLLVSLCSLVLSRYCTEHFYQRKHHFGGSHRVG